MADTFIKRVRRLTAIDIFLWVVRIAAVVFIVIGSVSSLTSGRLSAQQWRDLFVFGIAQGSVYALIALGLHDGVRRPALHQLRPRRGVHGGRHDRLRRLEPAVADGSVDGAAGGVAGDRPFGRDGRVDRGRRPAGTRGVPPVAERPAAGAVHHRDRRVVLPPIRGRRPLRDGIQELSGDRGAEGDHRVRRVPGRSRPRPS